MDRDAKLGPAAPAAAAAAAGGAGMFINRPTIPLAEYNSMKALSNGAKGPRSGAPADPPPPGSTASIFRRQFKGRTALPNSLPIITWRQGRIRSWRSQRLFGCLE